MNFEHSGNRATSTPTPTRVTPGNCVPVVNIENLTELQIKHYHVIQTLFTVYGITTPVTKSLCCELSYGEWDKGLISQ